MVYDAEAAIAMHPDTLHSLNASQIKPCRSKPNSTAWYISDFKQILPSFLTFYFSELGKIKWTDKQLCFGVTLTHLYPLKEVLVMRHFLYLNQPWTFPQFFH